MGSLILKDILQRGQFQGVKLRLVLLLDYFGATAEAIEDGRRKQLGAAQALLGKSKVLVAGGGGRKSSMCTVMALHWDAGSAASTNDVCKTIGDVVLGAGGSVPLMGLVVTTGIGFHGDIATMGFKDSQTTLLRQLAVNCVGPSILCQHVASLMSGQQRQAVAKGGSTSPAGGAATASASKAKAPTATAKYCPTILVLSSFSGLVGLPYRAHYCASKFALNGFLEGLHATYPETIRLVVVCPTSVSTAFRENWQREQQHQQKETTAAAAPVVNKADLTPEQCVAGVLGAWGQSNPRAGLEYVVLPAGKTALASWAVRLPLAGTSVRRQVLLKSKM
jgi:NAD(P)-dependent dehydrogenase (short-subunit alcohol dehydrogenase family)